MIKNCAKVAAILEDSIRQFTDVAVVGVSGGVDSAVVASIAVSALGKHSVYLVSMPYDDTDRTSFNARSAELAEQLGAHHLTVNIGSATDVLLGQFFSEYKNVVSKEHEELHFLTAGNTRARMRMATLYALAGELSYRYGQPLFSPGDRPNSQALQSGRKVRVLGTGNASEDLIGYDTKGGDALADLFVIGDLFKSEVYQLAEYYKVPESIRKAPPSAGLYVGQTDADELGYSYDELETALNALHKVLKCGIADNDIRTSLPEFKGVDLEKAEFVINRFKANAHKHRAPAVVSIRDSGYF